MLIPVTADASAEDITTHCREYFGHTDDINWVSMRVTFTRSVDSEGNYIYRLRKLDYASKTPADKVVLKSRRKGTDWTTQVSFGGSTVTKNDVPVSVVKTLNQSVGRDNKFRLDVHDSTGTASITSWIKC